MGCYPKTAREFLRRLTIRENWLRFAKSTPYTQTLTDNSAPSWANSRGLFYETNPIFRGPTCRSRWNARVILISGRLPSPAAGPPDHSRSHEGLSRGEHQALANCACCLGCAPRRHGYRTSLEFTKRTQFYLNQSR